MAWAKHSKRRAELPPDWAKRRKECIDNAGGRCQARLPSGRRCPRDATDADHKDDPNDHDNLQALCPTHHKIKTGEEARAAQQRHGEHRQREQHPGGRQR